MLEWIQQTGEENYILTKDGRWLYRIRKNNMSLWYVQKLHPTSWKAIDKKQFVLREEAMIHAERQCV